MNGIEELKAKLAGSDVVNGSYEMIEMDPYRDLRGYLKKVLKKSNLETNEAIEEIYVLYTEKGFIRGNHYHKKTLEYFTIISGTATIAMKSIEDPDAVILRVNSSDNLVIKVPPLVAHGFRNDGEEELVILAISSKEYNAADTDTFPMIVL
ncbi:MAG: WxcM-like domain-containing protein [Caulobacteraceae bacterium]